MCAHCIVFYSSATEALINNNNNNNNNNGDRSEEVSASPRYGETKIVRTNHPALENDTS